MLSNRMGVQKSTLKNQKQRTPYLTARGDHGKLIDITKLLPVKFAFVSGIAKGTVTTQSKRCLLVRNGDHH